MAEYIKREDVEKMLDEQFCLDDNDLRYIKQMVMDGMPSIDIVRCSECKYSNWLSDDPEDGVCNLRMRPPMQVAIDDYCSFGERKEQEHGTVL